LGFAMRRAVKPAFEAKTEMTASARRPCLLIVST
jgi:hypothetical protein